MAYDKNVAPFGWYLGSYLLRFMELDDPRLNDPDRRFLSWENTVLVRGDSWKEAFRKTEKIGRGHTQKYKGGVKGVPVKWEYVGVTQVLPIYEEIADGAEIAFTQRGPRTLRSLKELTTTIKGVRQA
jgi:hypothetical protein